jgi:hypothetical protein
MYIYVYICVIYSVHIKHLIQCFTNFVLLVGPLWPRKITTDPHILAHVNMECPGDGYPKVELIIGSYEYTYIPVA